MENKSWKNQNSIESKNEDNSTFAYGNIYMKIKIEPLNNLFTLIY